MIHIVDAQRDKISSLDDVKSMAQTDNNAVKQLALDHLGVIAARLRTSTLKFKLADTPSNGNTSMPLRPMEEVAKTFTTYNLMCFLMCFPGIRELQFKGLPTACCCSPRGHHSSVPTVHRGSGLRRSSSDFIFVA